MTDGDLTRLLTRDEAADFLHVDVSTLSRYVRDRRLKCQRGPRRVYFLLGDLIDFLATGDETDGQAN